MLTAQLIIPSDIFSTLPFRTNKMEIALANAAFIRQGDVSDYVGMDAYKLHFS